MLQGKSGDLLAKREEVDTHGGGSFGQQAGFGHAGNGVRFEHEKLAVRPQ